MPLFQKKMEKGILHAVYKHQAKKVKYLTAEKLIVGQEFCSRPTHSAVSSSETAPLAPPSSEFDHSI